VSAAAVDTARPSLGRLTGIELRKMTDTRAGFWLQLAVLAIALAVVLISALTGHAEDHRFATIFSDTAQGMTALLPVLGVLLVTSEWSQRTSLITFTLVPQRSRVVAAKLTAAVVMALVALVVALALAALGTIIASPGIDRTWSLSLGLLGQIAIYLATAMIVGVGFGAVLLNSAPAIVTYYLLPIGWSAIGSIHAIERTAKWLDLNRSMEHIGDRFLSGTEWGRVGTSLALWMVLPVLVGLWRILRNEIT
jgi:ABC-2 type transport system permease protein